MNDNGRGKGTITGALFIAVALIGGAYFFSGHHLPQPTAANAASSEELLQQYAAKDSDGDGLPDWEEALYGTDPHNPHSVRPDLTDAQAVAQGLVTPRYTAPSTASTTSNLASQVPGNLPAASSLTAQFSQLFFNNYLASRGNTPPSASDMQTFVQQTVAQLETTQVRTPAFAESNLTTSGEGSAALTSFAAAADQAFAANTANLPYDELTYLSDAAEKNDTTALKNVNEISKAYLATAQALAKIAVPKEAAPADLALVNAMAALGKTISDMGSLSDDPIRAMLGVQEYPSDVTSLTAAFAQMKGVFDADDVSIASPTPGWSFFHATSVAQAQETGTTTP